VAPPQTAAGGWKEWKRSHTGRDIRGRSPPPPRARPVSGPHSARATGGSPSLGSSPKPSHMPTGASRASQDSPIAPAVPGCDANRPRADPHAGWCRRAWGRPRPTRSTGASVAPQPRTPRVRRHHRSPACPHLGRACRSPPGCTGSECSRSCLAPRGRSRRCDRHRTDP
jgi:hypothetical protein